MNMHQMYGELVEKYQDECAEHRKTVDLLRRIVAGEVHPQNVSITGTGYNWSIATPVPQEVTDKIHAEVIEMVKPPAA